MRRLLHVVSIVGLALDVAMAVWALRSGGLQLTTAEVWGELATTVDQAARIALWAIGIIVAAVGIPGSILIYQNVRTPPYGER
jgi:hypothetical protein